jgi:hypothetical protein
MSNPVVIPNDLIVTNNLRIGGSITPTMAREDILSQVELACFTIPMDIWRIHDAYATLLTDSPATDDLGLVGGTFGTNAPSLQTDDFGGAHDAHYYARGEVVLPAEYEAGATVTIRLHAGMLTNVADQECTVDLLVYKSDEDATSTGDLCATDAETDNMNSLVFADIDFVITPTTLSPGDLLDVKIDLLADDDGDAGTMIACIGSVQLLCDIR